MKTKTRETQVDTELVDRINEIKAAEAAKFVEDAVYTQAKLKDAKKPGSGMMLRQCWDIIKDKLNSITQTNG